MTEPKRVKSNEARRDWAELLQFVRTGGTVIVEHYNKPIATIAPYEETAVLHTEKLAAQVTATLGDHPEDFHVDAIVEEIGDTYGRDTISVDVIPSSEYWDIVHKHERSVAIYTRTTDEGTEATKVIRNGEEVREIYTVDGNVCDNSIVCSDNADEYLRTRDIDLRADGYVVA